MDYRDKVFISVAENLSFSKAAAFLHISQPAVTRHIREMEERYRTNLFDRRGNKSLSDKGWRKGLQCFEANSEAISRTGT